MTLGLLAKLRSNDVFVVFALQIAMPTQDVFPKSVVLHFPPSVYQKTGASEMLPKLLQILQPDDLRCVQFLRDGRVRVSFREKAVKKKGKVTLFNVGSSFSYLLMEADGAPSTPLPLSVLRFTLRYSRLWLHGSEGSRNKHAF